MKKRICFAELHNPLFHGGKNHSQKLFAKAGVELWYDTEEKELLVEYQGKLAHLPSTSVHSYEEAGATLEQEVKYTPPDPFKPKGKIKAQVSGPTDHVFQGEGAGMLRDKR